MRRGIVRWRAHFNLHCLQRCGIAAQTIRSACEGSQLACVSGACPLQQAPPQRSFPWRRFVGRSIRWRPSSRAQLLRINLSPILCRCPTALSQTCSVHFFLGFVSWHYPIALVWRCSFCSFRPPVQPSPGFCMGSNLYRVPYRLLYLTSFLDLILLSQKF
jgi:hypothetical protein